MSKIFAALLPFLVFHTSLEAADKIRIAIPGPTISQLTFPVAQKRGFFREEGLEAEIISMRGNLPVAALVNGEIDYNSTVPLVLTAAMRGVPVKVLACYVPGSPYMLVARPEIKTVKELRGKTIAVGPFGGAPHVIGKMIVKHFGLDPDKDVKFLAAGGAESRFVAIKQGFADAAALTSPSDFVGKKMGFGVLARANEFFSYPAVGLTTSVTKIRERPDESKRAIKAGIKANRYIRANRDGTIQVMMEWLKIDKEMATTSYESASKAFGEDGTIPENGLRLLIEEAKQAAKVEREVALSEVVDLSILTQAQKALGIKEK